jgi:hypothetical protein
MVAGEAPPAMPYDPARMDWASTWDSAARIPASRRGLSEAVLSTTGVFMPPLPLINSNAIITPLQEAGSESRSVLHAGVVGSTAPATSGRGEVTRAPTSPAADDTIREKLSASPADIRDAAYALAAEFAEEVENLKRSRPNDAPKLAAHKKLEDFFERMASGLAALADALDQAVRKGNGERPEPVFLGAAAKIASELRLALVEWLEQNRMVIIDVPVRLALFGTGVAFLHSIGADGAAAITGLIALAFKGGRPAKSSGRKSKKRTTR